MIPSDTYIIEYDTTEGVKHTIKVKRCMSELHAKIKLGDYLNGKDITFTITSCQKDVFSIFGNVFSDIFNTKKK
jgi:hypothetical protein